MCENTDNTKEHEKATLCNAASQVILEKELEKEIVEVHTPKQYNTFPDVKREMITIEKIPCPECGVLLRPVEIVGKRHYKLYCKGNLSVIPKKRGRPRKNYKYNEIYDVLKNNNNNNILIDIEEQAKQELIKKKLILQERINNLNKFFRC